jgi:hypothetical protein
MRSGAEIRPNPRCAFPGREAALKAAVPSSGFGDGELLYPDYADFGDRLLDQLGLLASCVHPGSNVARFLSIPAIARRSAWLGVIGLMVPEDLDEAGASRCAIGMEERHGVMTHFDVTAPLKPGADSPKNGGTHHVSQSTQY